MTPDLTSLMPIALQVIGLGEAHVRTHPPRLVTSKGDRDMVTDVDLAVERMIRDFLADATPALRDPILAAVQAATNAKPDRVSPSGAVASRHAPRGASC